MVLETNSRGLLKWKRTLHLKCKNKQLLVNLFKKKEDVERILLERTKKAAMQSAASGSS